MKKKTFIQILRSFSKDESIEIKEFVSRFEESSLIENKYIVPKSFTKKSYQEYLKSDVWKNIRQRVISIHGNICESCGSNKDIQVHHTQYSKKVLTGESLKGLFVICKSCHTKIHLMGEKQINVKLKVTIP